MHVDRFRTPAIILAALLFCAPLASCGSDDSNGNGGDGSEDGGNGGTSAQPDDPVDDGLDELEFSFGLPGGDLSPLDLERDVFNALRRSCADGQVTLDQKWDGFLNPRAVLLYQSAVHVCLGELDAGRALFDRAAVEYGWAGINGSEADCRTYTAIVSVLEQVDQVTVVCTQGSPPGWPEGLPPHDDPRTEVDERTTGATTSSTDTTSAPTTTGTTATTLAAAGPTTTP